MKDEVFFEQYMTQLNAAQCEAVRAAQGATLLLAVPGSGKTTVLVLRLGYLVLVRGIAPESILTVTYTVAATEEMRTRFAAIFGAKLAAQMEFRTINGLSDKIIRHYIRYHSVREPFVLLENDGELAQLTAQCCEHLTGEWPTESSVKELRTAITYIKNNMLDGEAIAGLNFGIKRLPELYNAYNAALRERRSMDYDDQMAYALRILERYPEILAHFRAQLKCLCVDEAQDTSKIQHRILRLLSPESGDVFLVGDEDQSIYGFRAACPEALLDFEREHEGARVLFLEQNYRSTVPIVAAANAFVARNRCRREKVIRPVRREGAPLGIIRVEDRRSALEWLLQESRSLPCETAILYRNNDSALPLIDAFERSGTPYRMKAFDGSFFTSRVVQDVRDIIHLAYHPSDGECFLRIYYKLDSFISRAAAETAVAVSRRSGLGLLEALLRYGGLGYGAREKVEELNDALRALTACRGGEAVKLIEQLGYGAYVEQQKLDAAKLATLRLLGERVRSAKELLTRLDELQTITRTHENPADCRLTLSTIHSSKGLEYPRVFVLDAVDGVLPAVDEEADEKRYEEERRLFYVAMTRAKDELYLFRTERADSRFVEEVCAALPEEQPGGESVTAALRQDLLGKNYTHAALGSGRVVAQCEERLLIRFASGTLRRMDIAEALRERRRSFAPAPTAGETSATAIEPQSGMSVEHKSFGPGLVTATEGELVRVRFPDGSERRFVWRESLKSGTLRIQA